MPTKDPITASRDDLEIHGQALSALEHYYKHGDSMQLARLVLRLPKSNRRVAMLEWIKRFSVLDWDRTREMLVRKKLPENQNLSGAAELPFWTLKIKQETRRHVSGNTFEQDLFFDRVVADVQTNIELISSQKLERVIVKLQRLLAEKCTKAAAKRNPPSDD